MINPSKQFMQFAIDEAIKARDAGDYAVGAVIVRDDKIIAACGNRSKIDEDPVAHAEVRAIREACRVVGSRHLDGAVLYATHEPCPMCAAVAVWAKLAGIVYGARIADMTAYAQTNGNDRYLWRTIAVSCEEIVAKSTEKVLIVKDFMREDCIKLFYS